MFAATRGTGYFSAIGALLIGLAIAAPAVAQTSFIEFESGQVRPLALSPDGARLFAVNTPDNRLEIFDVTPGGVTHTGSVPVGMEPVAVAARTDGEVWVVNYLSDDISIVDVSGTPRVVRTLLVGDEPSDIVFAGPGGNRAFVTTAHRGQNHPVPRGDFASAGIGRADVWVFDALNLGATLGGTPITIVNLFGDKPRALAVSPDGSTVAAAIFRSGNQTTSINETLVCNTSASNITNNIVEGSCSVGGNTMPGGSPLPHKNHQGTPRPETGLILKLNRDGGVSDEWQDELGRDWSVAVGFDLPDLDVFGIDADANPPAQFVAIPHVGTTLFNMAFNPASGKLYVSNTDSQNHVRFEGFGVLASGFKPVGEPATVRGHLAEARISIIDTLGNVAVRHLNKHIDYSDVPQPAGVKEDSLATPTGIAVSDDGNTLYVAAFGSAKIGVFGVASLENDSFVPDSADHIALSAGGPLGVVLDGDRLYTLTRFNNAVVVVDLTQGAVGAEIQSVALHNPEPSEVVEGRPFLYDALLTGSNGESSCASCHIFGDMDDLAWDLGNPDDDVVANSNPFIPTQSGSPFHPMKGPMTTQSLRGLVNMGPEHWRGDRQGDSNSAFNAFNVAFPGLVGRDEGEFSSTDMQKFTDFALEIAYPPNPIRQLDDTLRADELAGRNRYFGPSTDGGVNCNFCHTLSPADGFFGGDGLSSVEGETQEFKIAHLRNAYQKVGMFGMANTPGLGGVFGNLGPQIRGFGYLHDGSIDTVGRFLSSAVFTLNTTEESDLRAFVMAFDSDLPPIVGQQITRTSSNGAIVDPRITLMINAAAAPYPSKLLGPGARMCDVIAKGVVNGEARGAVFDVDLNAFVTDRADDPPVGDAALRALANTSGQEITYTCVPFGSGVRMGIDRDLDGYFDRDEIDAGSDPADAASIPGGTATPLFGKKMIIKDRLPDDESKRKVIVLMKDAAVVAPAPGSADDPRCNGDPSGTVKATLAVESVQAGQMHVTDLPCQNWDLIGSEASPKGYKYKDGELDDGTAKIVLWKDGNQIKAVLQGKGPSVLDYDLVLGLSQGTVAAVLSSGDTRLCSVCGAYSGKDGSDGKKFLGKSCPAPVTCP